MCLYCLLIYLFFYCSFSVGPVELKKFFQQAGHKGNMLKVRQIMQASRLV